jgi:hypothetical protein
MLNLHGIEVIVVRSPHCCFFVTCEFQDRDLSKVLIERYLRVFDASSEDLDAMS